MQRQKIGGKAFWECKRGAAPRRWKNKTEHRWGIDAAGRKAKIVVLANQWGALTVAAVLFCETTESELFPSRRLLQVLSKPFVTMV